MESAIDANAPADYIEFRIFPGQNRYEACVYYGNKQEEVTPGLVEHLLLHSAEIRALNSKGSNFKYRLGPLETPHDNKWFTKSTLIRFLHIIGSANILEVTNSLKNEISQLEEARSFHLSLYAKNTKSQIQSGESEDSSANGMEPITKIEGCDASKNELLRAMDLRLTALRGELTAAFDQAAGSRYSVEEMTDIQKFSQRFGCHDFSESLHKYIELRQGTEVVKIVSSNQFLESDRVRPKEGSKHTSESFPSETRVNYGVSPAKVAQVERESSTESDESSLSSEEGQPSAERSHTLIRSASPRRSASPMRRVQIGRSGSRRSTAITIKSLNYIPARERSVLMKDPAANDSDEEGSRQEPKKSENSVRMSVQDAINLFESKQRDQTADIKKAGSLLNASIGANKSVLRRWSSGISEDYSRCPQDASTEDAATVIQNNMGNREVSDSSYPKSESKPDTVLEDHPIEPCGLDTKLNTPEKGACSPVIAQEETLPTKSPDVNEKLTASAEWSCQKEAELNELLMKMMETKPVKRKNVVPASNKRQSLPSERRGSSYNHYKEKRDEKLQGEVAREGAGRDKQYKAMQLLLDPKKSKIASAKSSDASGKCNVKKMQPPQRSVAEHTNPKSESPKLGVVKNASPKASSLPATRKSWPSVSSARASGPAPAKTPPATSRNGTMPTRRSQPTLPISHSIPKVETTQTRTLPLKSRLSDSKKSLGIAKKQQSVAKPGKTAKSEVQIGLEDRPLAAKPSSYSKVAKRSSVVPLESKPFLRKGSRATSNSNPAVKKKGSSPQEQMKKPEGLVPDEVNETVSNSSDLVIQHEERKTEAALQADVEHGMTMRSPQKSEDEEGYIQVARPTDEGIVIVVEAELKAEDEVESTISPTAWVEIEEHEDQPLSSGDHNQMAGLPAYAAPIGVSSPRVRHSLSQMLLEESSEPDVADWGNAENPPQIVYHKDEPKGLKRLLKFARKSKTEANASGWSSPSVFSEGEDDAEESKILNKRSAENLLRKATLHSKNNGHQRYSTDYEHSAQANISNSDNVECQVSASVTTTKATRSFFSLSAFKGNK